jgi:hypothetical protein
MLHFLLDKTFVPRSEPTFANFEKHALKNGLGFAKIKKLSPTLNLAQNKTKVL